MLNWLFGKKKQARDAQFYLRWAEDQMARGMSRQAVCNMLLSNEVLQSPQDMFGATEAERILFGVMLERNLKGKELEAAGRADEAIALYEANVADQFKGSHPYNRLRILYAKRHDYHNAIRVCEAAMAVGPDHINKSQMIDWVHKYRAKLQ